MPPQVEKTKPLNDEERELKTLIAKLDNLSSEMLELLESEDDKLKIMLFYEANNSQTDSQHEHIFNWLCKVYTYFIRCEIKLPYSLTTAHIEKIMQFISSILGNRTRHEVRLTPVEQSINQTHQRTHGTSLLAELIEFTVNFSIFFSIIRALHNLDSNDVKTLSLQERDYKCNPFILSLSTYLNIHDPHPLFMLLTKKAKLFGRDIKELGITAFLSILKGHEEYISATLQIECMTEVPKRKLSGWTLFNQPRPPSSQKGPLQNKLKNLSCSDLTASHLS